MKVSPKVKIALNRGTGNTDTKKLDLLHTRYCIIVYVSHDQRGRLKENWSRGILGKHDDTKQSLSHTEISAF